MFVDPGNVKAKIIKKTPLMLDHLDYLHGYRKYTLVTELWVTHHPLVNSLRKSSLTSLNSAASIKSCRSTDSIDRSDIKVLVSD